METIMSGGISPKTQLKQAQNAVEYTTRHTVSLQDATTALSEAVTPAQVAEVIVGQAVGVLGACSGLLVLLNKDGTGLELADSVGHSPDQANRWQHLSFDTRELLARVMQTGLPVFIESVETLSAHYPELAQYQLGYHHAFAALPLIVSDKVRGALGLGFAEKDSFSEDDRLSILTFTQHCAQALMQARLHEVERIARAEANWLENAMMRMWFNLA
jgi:GAF domain-containing protein